MYEGFTFTKLEPEYPGQKRSWARAIKVPMQETQDKLEARVNLRKRKGIPISKQYNALDILKRGQIDRLIEERSLSDNDPMFEHKLASIKCEERNIGRSMKETTFMEVILRRQFRPKITQVSGGPHIPFNAAGGSQFVEHSFAQPHPHGPWMNGDNPGVPHLQPQPEIHHHDGGPRIINITDSSSEGGTDDTPNTEVSSEDQHNAHNVPNFHGGGKKHHDGHRPAVREHRRKSPTPTYRSSKSYPEGYRIITPASTSRDRPSSSRRPSAYPVRGRSPPYVDQQHDLRGLASPTRRPSVYKSRPLEDPARTKSFYDDLVVIEREKERDRERDRERERVRERERERVREMEMEMERVRHMERVREEEREKVREEEREKIRRDREQERTRFEHERLRQLERERIREEQERFRAIERERLREEQERIRAMERERLKELERERREREIDDLLHQSRLGRTAYPSPPRRYPGEYDPDRRARYGL